MLFLINSETYKHTKETAILELLRYLLQNVVNTFFVRLLLTVIITMIARKLYWKLTTVELWTVNNSKFHSKQISENYWMWDWLKRYRWERMLMSHNKQMNENRKQSSVFHNKQQKNECRKFALNIYNIKSIFYINDKI